MIYYSVGGQKYLTNVDALGAFTLDPNKTLEMKFDCEFTNQPDIWQVEPPHSVDYYMDKHARILSEKYSKVHLRYSGGTDSNTVLQSFVRTGGVVDIEHITTEEMSDFSRDLYTHCKKDFADVAKLDAVNSFSVFSHRGLSQKEFERALCNYKGNLSSVMLNNSLYWDSNSATSTLLGVMENDVVVSGKEKPKLSVENGWWCWTAIDASFGDSQFTFDRGEHCWFYLSDNVPELQIKITWNKIKCLEKLARQQKVHVTPNWANDIQKTTSSYYQTINHAMGYRALNSVLDTVVAKMTEPTLTRAKEYRRWNDKNNITNLFMDYSEDVIKNLRSDLYTLVGQKQDHEPNNIMPWINISGVFHKSIPVCSVSKDLLPTT